MHPLFRIAGLLYVATHHPREIVSVVFSVVFGTMAGWGLALWMQVQGGGTGDRAYLIALALLSFAGSILATLGVAVFNKWWDRRQKREDGSALHLTATEEAETERERLGWNERKELRDRQERAYQQEIEYWQRVVNYHRAQEAVVRLRNHAVSNELTRLQRAVYDLSNYCIRNKVEAPPVEIVSETFLQEITSIDERATVLGATQALVDRPVGTTSSDGLPRMSPQPPAT